MVASHPSNSAPGPSTSGLGSSTPELQCACGNDFETQRGLNLHRNKCTAAKQMFAGGHFQKRKAIQVQKRAAKKARMETSSSGPSGNIADIPEDVAFPDIEPVQPVEPPPSFHPSGRPKRRPRLPGRLQDMVPSALVGPGRRDTTDRPRGVPEAYVPPPRPPTPPRVPTPPPAPTTSSAGDAVYQNCEPNDFGLFRSFLQLPTHDPEESVTLEDVLDAPTLQTAPAAGRKRWWSPFGGEAVKNAASNIFAPFLNATTFRLMNWFYSGSSMKSLGELDRLVHDVLLADDFDASDLRNFSAAREAQRLDEWEDEWEDEADKEAPQFKASDGWREASVHIRLPGEGKAHRTSEEDAPQFEVKGIFHRRLIEVIKAAFQDPIAASYNLIPYRLFWNSEASQTPAGESAGSNSSLPDAERIYSEVYNSDAMVDEYEKIQQEHPQEPGKPVIENVIAGIMLWSDSTHLAQFGTASLWPIYVFFANQSKYIRCKPSEFAAHHLAYIPSLPDTFQDAYKEFFSKAASSAVITHCKRELMQAIWELLLDDDFMEAYENGILLRFADGIIRRVFPRFFSYSADYPEKVLLTTIRYLGRCPCPRCLVLKSEIAALGTPADMKRRLKDMRVDDHPRRSKIERVRTFIFNMGLSLASKWLGGLLDPYSWVPTRNAFSTRLSRFGVNFYSLFPPDFLHEFELGTFKAVFIHLIRLLVARGGDTVQEMNKRYRAMPTFGRDTIGKFTRNTSGMKKLAARHWEQILKCSMPCFEGLFPATYDAVVQDLLFTMSTWHALAKLRMHTDSTVAFFKDMTTALGEVLRTFKDTVCEAYTTYELPSEEAARGRRAAAKKQKDGEAATTGKSSSGKKRRLFSMETYKLHSLGDYLRYILWLGPSDNYSTQLGELEHRRVKRFYARTNRNKYVRQIAQQQRREEILRKIIRRQKARRAQVETAQPQDDLSLATADSPANRAVPAAATSTPPTPSPSSAAAQKNISPSLGFADADPLPYTAPKDKYHVSHATKFHQNIWSWLQQTSGDPATKDFLPMLQDHLFSRLTGRPDDGSFTNTDRHRVFIAGDKMYRHKVLRVNYTTYDVRRAQDSLNPRTHADIMVLAPEDEAESDWHPYWFARIVGIYHVNVKLLNPDFTEPSGPSIRVDFLWVRWFKRDPTALGGWVARRLPRISFTDSTAPEDGPSFGFLDPAMVIRGVHLMPAYAHGHTSDLLGPSIVRQPKENDEDWAYYYVGLFVDRDMFMRFLGGGVGHRGAAPATHRPTRRPARPEYTWTEATATPAAVTSTHGTIESGPSVEELERDDGRVDEEDELDEEEEEDYGYAPLHMDEAEGEDEGEDGDEGEDEVEDPDADDGLGAEDGEGDAYEEESSDFATY
ncbi:hypothetical protein EIP91_001873 [Steccherinum ochraceum]|uniref:Uncharacterized protein n=1 Tax=Steccherinum ochraceum TaxID=92696 RepID=A0A4R0RJJ7_9APHY|nr:hypothetical protein EIP91_001873 [Steccherinum ochraceum]